MERVKRLAVRFPLLERVVLYTHYLTAAKGRDSPDGTDCHEPIRRRELVSLLRRAGLDVAPPRTVIFTYKYTPDLLFRLGRGPGFIAERLPVIRDLACTTVVVVRRAP